MTIMTATASTVAIPLTVALAACGASTGTSSDGSSSRAPTSSSASVASPTTAPSSTPTPTPTPLSALEAKRDIKIGAKLVITYDNDRNHTATVPVTVTNDTAQRSSYDLKLDLINRSGTQLDFAYLTLKGIDPGHTVNADAEFVKASIIEVLDLSLAHVVQESAMRVGS